MKRIIIAALIALTAAASLAQEAAETIDVRVVNVDVVVRDRSGRPFDLKARNTLAVLTGSFLSVESGADAPAAGQSIRATLGKVTTYLTDHLVRQAQDR